MHRYVRNAAGTLLRQVDQTYAINNTTLPYTALNTASQFTEKLTGGDRSSQVTRSFDTFANITHLVEHGNLASIGDERHHVRDYSYNTDRYRRQALRPAALWRGGHKLHPAARHPLPLGQSAVHHRADLRQPDPGRSLAEHRQHTRRHGDDLRLLGQSDGAGRSGRQSF
ncbi:hypothetical protein CHELA1G11_12829 [Hyphomicrobiales bacterium]|nr:hypothetical protein CHELA1G2_11480 [Hyphomicrobiales bacterium]CAH1667412.1 hypothetical protein CHELA1G11_12829 [Hyphomicrobiales bacterium]